MSKTEYEMNLDLLMSQARVIASLPLEEMIESLEWAETTGAFLDPTLYQEYLESPNGPILKDIMSAALDLKREVEKARASI